MNSSDVLELVRALQQAGIEVWLDGGWGIDALLGRQTREHADLDVVVSLADVETIKHAFSPSGFVVAADELPTRFVLQDQRARHIDFHTVTFDPEGGGIQQLQDGRSYRYPPQGFAGMGMVDGHQVRCLTAQVQADGHYGYEPDANDHHDMCLLQEHFGIPLKAPYASTLEVLMMGPAFVGTWRLISHESRTADGRVRYPFGRDVHGYLTYTADGHMSVAIMGAHRQQFRAANDFTEGTPEEQLAAGKQYLSYAGTYEVRADGIMLHHVEVSLFPNWVGGVQERLYTLEGDRLTLSTRPVQIRGQLRTSHLVWERVSQPGIPHQERGESSYPEGSGTDGV